MEEAGLGQTLKEDGIQKDREKRKIRGAFKERHSDMFRCPEDRPHLG